MPIALQSGDAELLIEPAMGGAIARYAWRGRDVLRRAPNNARKALDMGCFPLVPFANRIAHGVFSWDGRPIRLPLNFGPHALHGHGWERAWTVTAHEAARAVLAFEHEADAWPWAYRAEQVFRMNGGALQAELSVTNRGDSVMPVSLGFHPYFPRYPHSQLTASVAGVWLSDTTQIPTTLAGPTHFVDLANGAMVGAAPFIDNCYTGWAGTAEIDQPEDRLGMAISAQARFLHVFVPTGESYFCAEPVTAMPDAVNRKEPHHETGLRALSPGATFSISMTVTPRGT